MRSFHVYILCCSDGSYYTGHTEDLEARLVAHQQGTMRGYTSNIRHVQLVYSSEFSERVDALEMERRIKGWSRRKKEALIRGDWDEIRRLLKGQARPSFDRLRNERFTEAQSPSRT